MNIKIITLTIIGMFLFTALASTITIADEESNGIFGSEISFQPDTKFEQPISPNETNNVNINVKYKINIGDFAKWFFFKRRIGRMVLFGLPYIFKFLTLPKAVINLSIIEKPSWCEAKLSTDSLEFPFNNKFEENNVELSFSINDTAPALKKNNIIIEAVFIYQGNGSLTNAYNTTTISFRPVYKSELEIDNIDTQLISPLKETIIPISITNLGNGETIADIELEGDTPIDWNISFDPKSAIIPINKGDNIKLINLIVTSPKDFENENINIKVTAKSVPVEGVNETYLQGKTYSISLNLINDGSLKEEEFKIDTTLLIGIITIIVIVIIIIAIIILRRKK